MRNYPLNSPQAAARLVTLAMLSDGHLSRAELNALERLGIDQQLGLSPAAMHEVVQAFCEDMLATAASAGDGMCRVDPQTIRELASEVTEPALQTVVLQLCAEVIAADDHMADGESLAMAGLLEHWSLMGEVLHTRPREAATLHACILRRYVE